MSFKRQILIERVSLAPQTPPTSSLFPREVVEEPYEAVFRPLRKPDGELVVEQLPLTLDVLLDPRIEDQMSQQAEIEVSTPSHSDER